MKAYLLFSTVFLFLLSGICQAQEQATVNWNDVHQVIDGFGASSAWISSLTESQADMFFSVNNGIGLSLLRSGIQPDGSTMELSVMQQAQDRGAKVWSTPWSPPSAWKDNNDVNNGGHLLSGHYQDYANQLADYAANMKNAGINLYAISIQNEPDYTATYQSCIWSAQNFHDFIPLLYNALAAKGMSSTKIMFPESATWNFNLVSTTMSDSNTADMVDIIAAHGYFSTVSAVNTYDKQLWETEVSSFESFDGSMSNALNWAANIHQYLTVAEANAWNYWWLISLNADNEGLTDQSGNPAKRMYVLGQFSKFVRPGYYRIGAATSGNVLVSAYKDPASGKFAIVTINTNGNSAAMAFNLNGFSSNSVTPWITSDTLSLAQQPAISAGSSFTYTLPASSVVTFVGQTGSLQTCSQLGGSCCSSGQTCSGSFQSSSDCSNCCIGTCQTPSQTCGNNLREGTEICDGSDLAGQSCISRGFTGGTLTCNSQCSGFVTTGCTSSQYFLPEVPVQAESGTLSSMLTGSDISASNGQYIYTSTSNQSSASYTFQIQSPGKYRMEARVLTPDPNPDGHNSFFVGLDSEPAQGNDIYAYDAALAPSFAWDNVSLRGPQGNFTWSEYDPKVWDLTQGLHTFTFYGRETNTWLDQIILKRACHKSDSNCDSCVSEPELTAFISRWYISNTDVTIAELMQAIGLWKAGGC